MAGDAPRAPRCRLPLKRSVLAPAVLWGLLLALCWAGTAQARECFPLCARPVAQAVLADYEDDHSSSDYRAKAAAARAEREAAREQRRLLEAKQRAQRASEARARERLRSLERKLNDGKRDDRFGRSRSRAYSGYYEHHGSNDGQAGAHCIYGPDDQLLHAPEGMRCAQQKGGVDPGPAAIQPPARSGCAEGDCRNGAGIYVWADGSRYEGSFEGGLQHGQGSIAFKNGARYAGGWHQGMRSGVGTAIFPDGRVKAGRWKENRFLGDATSGSRADVRIDWPDLSRPARSVGGGEKDVAVIVGIERYAHVSDIAGAARNATDWYRYMVKTRGLPTDRVMLLLDEDATREEMRRAAQEAARLAGRDGKLWFVFIGHGAPAPSGRDGMLVGYDAQQKARSLSARSLRRSELLEVLEKSRADQVHVVIDACFSGKNTAGEALVAGLQPLVVVSSEPTSDARTTLFTAAAHDQYAGPLPGADRPAFSYLLLGGLRGWADLDADGRVSAGELHRYASKTMRAMIRGRDQTPTLIGAGDLRIARSPAESGPDIADLILQSKHTAGIR